MQNRIVIGIGNDSFEGIRESGFFYVDKSRYIKNILESGATAILFTRPRRFGKTTFLSTLSSFLDIRKSSSRYFEDLDIYKDGVFIEKWMNKYPLIYLTLKDVDGSSFDSAYGKLRNNIAELFRSYSFLLEKTALSAWDKKTFLALCNKEEERSDFSSSLLFLSRILYEHYKKKVFILIDEYDVPLAKADINGYYKDMISEIRSLFSYALKGNDYLYKAVLTGCLKVSKESLFTGINNMDTYSLTESRYSSLFGFTDEEVRNLLIATDLEEKEEEIRLWYDGYQIGDDNIYCPWDVLKYVSECIEMRNARPKNYWANTSGNEAVEKLIENSGKASRDECEVLLNGGSIRKQIKGDLTYFSLYDDVENIWSLLFYTGYITLSGQYDEEYGCNIRIPNVEIKNIFKSFADKWFEKKIKDNNVKSLFSFIWNKKAEELSKILSDALFDTISYYDYSEAYYHGFLSALLKSGEYSVKSNRETGLGRADIVLIDGKNNRVAIFELKRSKSYKDMEKDAEAALKQIDLKKYDEEIYSAKHVLKYGITFYKKSALALLGN